MTRTNLALLALLALAAPARAEMGACHPDTHDGLICGDGDGAARVIDGTMSPAKTHALAWRDLTGPPTEDPDTEKLESILVRLSDGTILARTEGAYWNTGERRANRMSEDAAWSPNSRLVVRIADSRFSTDAIQLHLLGKNDAVSSVDLRALVAPAVDGKLRKRVRNADSHVMSVPRDRLSVDNTGRVRLHVVMAVPKQEGSAGYDLVLQASSGKGPGARIVSIRSVRPAF